MKDKRTRDELIRLLDKAIGTEEKLTARIAELESQLLECQKQAEDPRHELANGALPASKVPFRIDFYRTSDNGPVKGVIEHLTTRKKKNFTGRGAQVIADFIGRYLPAETGAAPVPEPPAGPVVASKPAPPTPTTEPTGVSPLLRRLVPDLFPLEPSAEPTSGRRVRRTGHLFAVIPTGGDNHEGALSKEHSFVVQIPLKDLQAAADTPLLARLQAEDLESGHSDWIAKATAHVNADLVEVAVEAGVLSPGAYRFTASLADTAGTCYRESRLVVVH